jgi:hypothetical protein
VIFQWTRISVSTARRRGISRKNVLVENELEGEGEEFEN